MEVKEHVTGKDVSSFVKIHCDRQLAEVALYHARFEAKKVIDNIVGKTYRTQW